MWLSETFLTTYSINSCYLNGTIFFTFIFINTTNFKSKSMWLKLKYTENTVFNFKTCKIVSFKYINFLNGQFKNINFIRLVKTFKNIIKELKCVNKYQWLQILGYKWTSNNLTNYILIIIIFVLLILLKLINKPAVLKYYKKT